AAIVVVLIGLVSGGDRDQVALARGRGAADSLAFDLGGQPGEGAASPAAEERAGAPRATNRRGERPARRASRARPPSPPVEAAALAIVPPRRGGDEVAIGRSGATARPLDGNDLLAVQQRNQAGLQMCFTRALKRDPALRV